MRRGGRVLPICASLFCIAVCTSASQFKPRKPQDRRTSHSETTEETNRRTTTTQTCIRITSGGGGGICMCMCVRVCVCACVLEVDENIPGRVGGGPSSPSCCRGLLAAATFWSNEVISPCFAVRGTDARRNKGRAEQQQHFQLGHTHTNSNTHLGCTHSSDLRLDRFRTSVTGSQLLEFGLFSWGGGGGNLCQQEAKDFPARPTFQAEGVVSVLGSSPGPTVTITA
jgi:hypothetical protein